MQKVAFRGGLAIVLVAMAAGMALAQVPTSDTVPLTVIEQVSPLLGSMWFWRPEIAGGGQIRQDSYFSKFEAGSGVWELGLFTRAGPGFRDPKTFQAIFGLATDATCQAAFEITICGNPCEQPVLAKFEIDQNHPVSVCLPMTGLYRLEVKFRRIAGDGNAVMIAPTIAF